MLIDISFHAANVIKRALQGYNFVLNKRLHSIMKYNDDYENDTDYKNILLALKDNETVLLIFNKI